MSPQKKPAKKSLHGKTILLGVSGSIAAYRACDLVRQLRAEGANVICMMSRSAERFVSSLTFHSLSGNRVYTDPFAENEDWNVIHTTLADQADLILIMPATANLIARLAAGFADDMVTSVVLAANPAKTAVLICPAMNDRMFTNKLTQENIARLRHAGYRFIDPIEGDLVCGRAGVGHVADGDRVLDQVTQLLHAF